MVKEDIVIGIMALILIAVMVVFNVRVVGFQYISFYFLFYALGYLYHKYDIKLSMLTTIVICLLWFVTALFWRSHEVPAPFVNIRFVPATILIYCYRYIAAILGSLFVLSISPHIFSTDNGLINKCTIYLGKVSLGIYVVHLFTHHLLDKYGVIEQIYNSDSSFAFIITFFFVILCAGVLGTYLLSMNKWTSKIFLGK